MTGCEAYKPVFQNEEIVELEDILKLSEGDLKEMGLKIGAKNRVMDCIQKLKSGSEQLRPKKQMILP